MQNSIYAGQQVIGSCVKLVYKTLFPEEYAEIEEMIQELQGEYL